MPGLPPHRNVAHPFDCAPRQQVNHPHTLRRIGEDYQNSIPLGQTSTTTRSGRNNFSLLSVDTALISDQELRTAIRQVAVTGKPAWNDLHFDQVLLTL